MTLIVCFDRSPLENIAGCIHLQPAKLILLGDIALTQPVIHRYRNFLRSRGLDTQVILKELPKNDLEQTAQALADLVLAEGDCVIDLAGGDSRTVMAVGAMVTRLTDAQRNRVSVQKFDPVQQTLVDCDNDGYVVQGNRAALSAKEIVALLGGSAKAETHQLPSPCTPEELDPLWAMVAADPKNWNRSLSTLGEFESRSESKTQISLDLEQLRGQIRDFEGKYPRFRNLIEEFSRRGIIHDRSSHHIVRYEYASPLLRYCTQKAGNVLEVKTLLEAMAMTDQGQPWFDDCQISVTIDWDGITHDPMERIPDTKNEIDVLLTRGLTPLFISCKNGDIGDEELYKLHTVATRFGGIRAKKMLIATNLDRKSAAADRSFLQRAWDMDIFVVTDADELSRADWAETFRTAML